MIVLIFLETVCWFTFHAFHDFVTAVCSPDKQSSLGVLHRLRLPLLQGSFAFLGLRPLNSLENPHGSVWLWH